MALATMNFFSKSLMRTVTINVVIPTDKIVFPGMPVPEKKPSKTLYLLHGILGNYTDWVTGTRIQALANDRNLCVVMPGNGLHVGGPTREVMATELLDEKLEGFCWKGM